MAAQHDLFGEERPPLEDEAPVEAPLLPLAVPCGFRNRRNAPCQRLAHRAMRCDGKSLKSRGRPLLHCVLACFDAASAEDVMQQAEAAE